MQKSDALNCLIRLTEGAELDFNECLQGFQNMLQIADEYPQTADYLVSALKCSLRQKVFCLDLSPTAQKLAVKISTLLDNDNAKHFFDEIAKERKEFAFRCAGDFMEANPELAEHILKKAKEAAAGANCNFVYPLKNVFVKAIKLADTERSAGIIKEAFEYETLRTSLYAAIPDIYRAHPEHGDMLLEAVTDERNLKAGSFGTMYKNLAQIALLNIGEDENTVYIDENCRIDESIPPKVLDIMEKSLDNPCNDFSGLNEMYKALGRMMEAFPQYDERIKSIINRGLQNPANTKIARKSAYKALGDYEKLCSQISIHQRVRKTEDNEFGIKNCSQIEKEKPCVLVLGGDGVRNEKTLNGYMGEVYRALEQYDLQEKVNVYGVVYDFGEYLNLNAARTKMMEDYCRSVKLKHPLNDETLIPKYVKELFAEFICPRIESNGNKIAVNQAMNNMRRLNIFAHCHGAYTAMMLEKMSLQRMKELGYTPEEASKIQKQLLVVAQSPYCPLGQSQSTFISFASAGDFEIEHHNNFEAALRAINEKEEIPLSYFPKEKGELFLVNRMELADEHNFWGFTPYAYMKKDAQNLIELERNALINGLKSSLKNQELPEVKQIVTDGLNSRCLLQKALANGQKIYHLMSAIAFGVARYRALNEKGKL
ncbi:MAG: hypothetical protein IJ689_05455 [Alphaproteobacteria bacterium]|nr:hypothetical protein [Alphaproteobacteria bacterium]